MQVYRREHLLRFATSRTKLHHCYVEHFGVRSTFSNGPSTSLSLSSWSTIITILVCSFTHDDFYFEKTDDHCLAEVFHYQIRLIYCGFIKTIFFNSVGFAYCLVSNSTARAHHVSLLESVSIDTVILKEGSERHVFRAQRHQLRALHISRDVLLELICQSLERHGFAIMHGELQVNGIEARDRLATHDTQQFSLRLNLVEQVLRVRKGNDIHVDAHAQDRLDDGFDSGDAGGEALVPAEAEQKVELCVRGSGVLEDAVHQVQHSWMPEHAQGSGGEARAVAIDDLLQLLDRCRYNIVGAAIRCRKCLEPDLMGRLGKGSEEVDNCCVKEDVHNDDVV